MAYHQLPGGSVRQRVQGIADGFVAAPCQLHGSGHVALPAQIEDRLVALLVLPAGVPSACCQQHGLRVQDKARELVALRCNVAVLN